MEWRGMEWRVCRYRVEWRVSIIGMESDIVLLSLTG